MKLTREILSEIGFKNLGFTTSEYRINPNIMISLTWYSIPTIEGKYYSGKTNCTITFKDMFYTRSIPTLPIETVEELKELFDRLHKVDWKPKISFEEILKREII